MGSENEAKIKHILGVDYGRSKVGLALADSETKIAFVHSTLDNNHALVQKILAIISEEKVDTVVIGIPSHIHPNTNSHKSSDKQLNILRVKKNKIGVGVNREETVYDGEKFAALLKAGCDVAIEYQDEMFTTKMAQAKLIERGVKGIKRFDDQEAARIILQEWMDRRLA